MKLVYIVSIIFVNQKIRKNSDEWIISVNVEKVLSQRHLYTAIEKWLSLLKVLVYVSDVAALDYYLMSG